MQRRIAAILFLSASTTATASPPAWKPDPTFADNGTSSFGLNLGAGNWDVGNAVTQDSRGRIYLVGQSSMAPAGNCQAVTRYLPNGQRDAESYGDDGSVCLAQIPGAESVIERPDALIQGDDKLIVAGTVYPGHPIVCRFGPAGELDDTFGSASTAGCVVFDDITNLALPANVPSGFGAVDIAVGGDDGIFLAMTEGGSQDVRIARLTPDGGIVPFGEQRTRSIFEPSDQMESAATSDIVFTADGKLIVAGELYSEDTTGADFFVARIDPDDGSRDPSFNGGDIRRIGFDRGGDHSDIPVAVAITDEGEIVVAGVAQSSSNELVPAMAVLTESGEFSPQFNEGKPVVYDPCVFHIGVCNIYVSGLALAPGGNYLLGGYTERDGKNRMFTMRVNHAGATDAHYGPGFPGQAGYAVIASDFAEAATSMLLHQGHALLAGWRDTNTSKGVDFIVTRLSDGSLFADEFDDAAP